MLKLGLVAAFGLVIVGACTQVDRDRGGGTTKPPTAKVLPVAVQLTAATLADDCGRAEAAQGEAAPGFAAADCAGPGDCGMCQQTSMQLSFVAGDGRSPAAVKIAKVKLFDAKTKKLLGELVPRNPRSWSDAGVYATWNESINPAQKLQVTYDLTSPDWGAITGTGRWGAQDMTFRLQAVIKVGGETQTVETIVESADLMIEPPVVT